MGQERYGGTAGEGDLSTPEEGATGPLGRRGGRGQEGNGG